MLKVFGPIGSGEKLILLHGALSDAAMWEPHQQLVADSFETYSATQRHFGKDNLTESTASADSTDIQNHDFNLETHAADLAEYLRQEVDDTFHILAWSYGADVALSAATLVPEKIRSLFLYELGAPHYFTAEADLETYFGLAQSLFKGVMDALETGNTDLAIERLMEASAQEKGYFHSQPERLQNIQNRNGHSLKLQLSQRLPTEIPETAWNHLRMPITLAYGEDSHPLFQIATQAAAQRVPHSTLVEIPNATHMLPLEDPETFMSWTLKSLKPKSIETDSEEIDLFI